MTLLPLRPPVKTHPRPSAPSAEKSVAELNLWIEADSVLSVSSCKFLFELLKNPLRLRRLENDVAQRNASASVASFELRALCDEKSCLENKILRVCNTDKPAIRAHPSHPWSICDRFDPNPFYRSSQRTQRLTRGRLIPNYSASSAPSCKIPSLNQEISAH